VCGKNGDIAAEKGGALLDKCREERGGGGCWGGGGNALVGLHCKGMQNAIAADADSLGLHRSDLNAAGPLAHIRLKTRLNPLKSMCFCDSGWWERSVELIPIRCGKRADCTLWLHTP
jgi:hypothetical protein